MREDPRNLEFRDVLDFCCFVSECIDSVVGRCMLPVDEYYGYKEQQASDGAYHPFRSKIYLATRDVFRYEVMMGGLMLAPGPITSGVGLSMMHGATFIKYSDSAVLATLGCSILTSAASIYCLNRLKKSTEEYIMKLKE